MITKISEDLLFVDNMKQLNQVAGNSLGNTAEHQFPFSEKLIVQRWGRTIWVQTRER